MIEHSHPFGLRSLSRCQKRIQRPSLCLCVDLADEVLVRLGREHKWVRVMSVDPVTSRELFKVQSDALLYRSEVI